MVHTMVRIWKFHQTFLIVYTTNINFQPLIVTINHSPFIYFFGFGVAILLSVFGIYWVNIQITFNVLLFHLEAHDSSQDYQNFEVYVSL